MAWLPAVGSALLPPPCVRRNLVGQHDQRLRGVDYVTERERQLPGQQLPQLAEEGAGPLSTPPVGTLWGPVSPAANGNSSPSHAWRISSGASPGGVAMMRTNTTTSFYWEASRLTRGTALNHDKPFFAWPACCSDLFSGLSLGPSAHVLDVGEDVAN